MIPALLLAAAAPFLHRATAQSTDAVCLDEFSWMNNAEAQSPCLMTSYLYTPCYGVNGSNIAALQAGFVYTGATTPATGTNCVCSTVTFSVLAACAVCQGRGVAIDAWPKYSNFCSTPSLESYPYNIPLNTSIPHWAYQDVQNQPNSTFNVVLAESVASQNLPESTHIPASTSATSSSTSSAGGSTTAPPPSVSTTTSSGESKTTDGSNTTSTPSSKSKSNTGAIVGGVVGGLAFLGLVGAGVFFYMRRRRGSGMIQDVSYGGEKYGAPVVAANDLAPGSGGAAAAESQPMLYDPNDPRTFPTSGDLHSSEGTSQSFGGPTTVDSSLHAGSANSYGAAPAPYGGAYGSSSFQTNGTFPSQVGYTGRPEL